MPAPRDPPAGVLILGNLPRVVVPIARSLRARGLTVHAASIVSRRPIRSRAIRSSHLIPFSPDQPAEFQRELRAIVERLDIGAILPTGDDILQALAPVYDELKERLIFCCPAPAIYQQVLRKEVALTVARHLGIPVPLPYDIANAESLEAQRNTIHFPVIAKVRANAYQARTGIRARRFDTYTELEAVFRRFPLFGQWFLIQEYLPGEGVGVDILMRNGEAAMVFQHRRVRELPYTGGVSVAADSEPVDPVLAGYAVALLRALNWSGVAMVEFRSDRATGRTELMEVNGRFWGSLALSIHAGLDFPFHAWEAAHGIAPSIGGTVYRKARCRWLLGDTRRLVEVMRSSVRRRASVAWTARQIAAYVRDFFPPVRDTLWSWSDPGPTFQEGREIFDWIMLPQLARIAHWILPPRWIRKLKNASR